MRSLLQLATLATLGRGAMVKFPASSATAASALASTAGRAAFASASATPTALENTIAKAAKKQAKREAAKAQKEAKKKRKAEQRQQHAVKAKAPPPRREELVIVGLGNVGSKYKMTRHNVGFLVVDVLAERLNLQFAPDSKLKALVASGSVDGRKLHLIKPTTMMNLSGESVRRVLAARSLPKSAVLVVVDDVALPFGAMRLRLKGSAGGHNGLKDIERHLGGQDYARLKIGVGAAGAGDLIDHVLGEFDREEQSVLPHVLTHIAERCQDWATTDDVLQKVIERANTKARPQQ